MENIIVALIGSSVVSAIISGISSYIQYQKTNNLTHITLERQKWREELRDISKDICKTSGNQLKQNLAKLKVRINAFGIKGETKYSYDSHIWKIISDIENQNNLETEETNKTKLINSISLLLKFDWERSKMEIQGNRNILTVIIFWIMQGFFEVTIGISLFTSGEFVAVDYFQYIHKAFSYNVIGFLIIAIVFIAFKIFKDNISIKNLCKFISEVLILILNILIYIILNIKYKDIDDGLLVLTCLCGICAMYYFWISKFGILDTYVQYKKSIKESIDISLTEHS